MLVAILIVVLALAGVAGFLLYRRRRSTDIDIPPPDIGSPIDYTSLPAEEKVPLQERIASLPMAVKILIPVLVLLLLGAGVAVAVWPNASNDSIRPTPTPEPEITITRALVDRTLEQNPGGSDTDIDIVIQADTTIRGGIPVTAEVQLDGEPFPWYDPASARTTVQTETTGLNAIEMRLIRSYEDEAPALNRDPSAADNYTVVLRADMEPAITASEPLRIPSRFQATPRPTPRPTITPTLTPTEEIAPPPEPLPEEPVAEPTPAPLTAVAANGGRMRASPEIADNVVSDAGVMAGDQVELLERSGDGWYRVYNPRNDLEGWVGGSLLTIDPALVEQIPLQGSSQAPQAPPPEEPPVEEPPVEEPPVEEPPVEEPPVEEPPAPAPSGLFADVANGGNVRAAPSLEAQQLDTVNAGERVELLSKSEDGIWYQIVTERDVTGWTHVSLLSIDEATINQVPVQGNGTTTSAPETQPVASGVTAQVSMDGGHVHAQPDEASELLTIIDGGQQVDVLLRTRDGIWYQVRTPQEQLVGWVIVSELFLNPGGTEALTRVPVWEVETPVSDAEVNGQTEVAGSAAPIDSNMCPESHPIKGTTTGEGEKLYLLSFSGNAYEVTPPEICFSNEREAQEAGYRMYVPGDEY